MKFEISTKEFSAALKVISQVAEQRSPMDVISNTLITADERGLTMMATNLNTELVLTLDAEIEESGVVAAPAKQINDWVGNVTGETVKGTIKENRLVLKSGRSSSRIMTINPEIMPFMDRSKLEIVADGVSPSDLLKSMDKAYFAIDKRDSVLLHGSACIDFTGERILVYGGNGFVLSKRFVRGEIKKNTYVHLLYNVLANAMKIVDLVTDPITILAEPSRVEFVSTNVRATFLQVDVQKYDPGIFFDLGKVTCDIKINSKNLYDAIKRVSSFMSDDIPFVDMKTRDDDGEHYLVVETLRTTDNAEVVAAGHDEVYIPDISGNFSSAYSFKYLLAVLKSIDSEITRIQIKQTGGQRASFISFYDDDDSGGFAHIIAPKG